MARQQQQQQQRSSSASDRITAQNLEDEVRKAVGNAVRTNERKLRDAEALIKRLENDLATANTQTAVCESELMQVRTQYRNKLNELFLAKPENSVLSKSGDTRSSSPGRHSAAGRPINQDPERLLNEILSSYVGREKRIQDELKVCRKGYVDLRDSSRLLLDRLGELYIGRNLHG
jgi:hypothetical protein